MSILDDAIREHLELKRAHGADDAELKRLEDEAFGPPQRPDEPDPFAEAPTEFLVAPGADAASAEGLGEESGRRAPNITDLQEAPPAPAEDPAPEPAAVDEAPAPEAEEAPAVEEHPAQEHEAIADSGHSTEERHAIAEQPTEMFDVQGQFEDAATEADAPSDEDLVEAGLAEPRLAPVDPLPQAEEEPADEFDEFFSEQRLSDELNQALEAPLPDEPSAPATEEETALYDVEVVEPDYPEPEPEASEENGPPAAAGQENEDDEEPPATADHRDDVLEDTPEFLEDAPEDDNLWFEQKPPKDIDFGD